jgi:hypothetical protein
VCELAIPPYLLVATINKQTRENIIDMFQIKVLLLNEIYMYVPNFDRRAVLERKKIEFVWTLS